MSAKLPGLLAADGLAAPLLNGLDSEDVVARDVGAPRVIAAIAYMSSGVAGPGEIETLAPTRAGLAPYRPGQEARVEATAALLERAGIPVRRGADHRAMLWEKMVWNAPFNAICALTGQRAGVVAERMEDLTRTAMLEVISVARAEGAEISEATADAMLALTRSEFPLTEPSMLQDVRAGRATEVDILQGAVVERAGAGPGSTPRCCARWRPSSAACRRGRTRPLRADKQTSRSRRDRRWRRRRAPLPGRVGALGNASSRPPRRCLGCFGEFGEGAWSARRSSHLLEIERR